MKHRHELFIPVSNPQVAADSNLAERSLVGTWTAQRRPLRQSFRPLLLSRPPA